MNTLSIKIHQPCSSVCCNLRVKFSQVNQGHQYQYVYMSIYVQLLLRLLLCSGSVH